MEGIMSYAAPNMSEHIISDVEYHSDSGQSSILTRSSDGAFPASVLAMMNSPTQTTELVSLARTALKIFELSGMDKQVSVPGHSINVHRLLNAMLKGAKISGGERYTASAIIAAAEHDGCIQNLANLAQNWLFCLLLPIKKAFKNEDYNTLDLIKPIIHNSEVDRLIFFRDTVAERDGHRCAMTHLWDLNYEVPIQNAKCTEVVATHILRRSIMSGEGTGINDTLPASLDILRHYAALPNALVDDFTAWSDTAENGMMLDAVLHIAYDDFRFCLMATEEVNKYTVHWFGNVVPYIAADVREVRFTDHSLRGTPLPNPKFIAIHAAIAHVLHLSGAGELIDAIIDRFFENGVVPASRTVADDDSDMALRMSLMELEDDIRRL